MAVIAINRAARATNNAAKTLLNAISSSTMRAGGGGDAFTVRKMIELLDAIGDTRLVEDLTRANVSSVQQIPDNLLSDIIKALNKAEIVAKLTTLPTGVESRKAYNPETNQRDGEVEHFTKWDFVAEVGRDKKNINLTINLTDKTTSTVWANNLTDGSEVKLEFSTAKIQEQNAVWVRCK